MAKIVKNSFGNFLIILVIFSLITGWIFSGWPQVWQNPPIPPKIQEVRAAVTYFGSASTPTDSSTATNTTNPTAVTPPADMQLGDLVLMFAWGYGTTDPVINQAGGQTWNTLAVRTSTSRDGRTFWAKFNGTWSANPSVTMPGASNNIVVMHVFRPTNGANTWAVDVAEVNGTFTAGSSPYTKTITGVTTLTNGAVAVAVWASADDNTWGSLAGAGWNVLGSAQYRNTSGYFDNSQTFAYQVKATAGATGNVSKNQATLGGDAGTTSIIAFKEVNNPSSLTISQPDGVSDTVTVGQSYNITYDLSDAEDVATVDFYYDSNSSGLDGIAITGCQDQAEGTDVTCSWNTTGMTPGDYYVYGIATDGVNSDVNDYSPGVITIQSSIVYSVSVEPTSVNYGGMAMNTTKASVIITATVGDAATKLNIKGANATYTEGGKCGDGVCTWTLSGALGQDQYVHAFTKNTGLSTGGTLGSDPSTEWVALTIVEQLLAASVSANSSQDFKLDMRTPSSAGTETDLGSQYSTNVTIVATAP